MFHLEQLRETETGAIEVGMWVALTLVTAVCTALRDVTSKQATRAADPLVVGLGVAAVPAVVLGALVAAGGPAAPRAGYWTALAVSGGVNAVATPLIVWALKRSDLSLVSPVTSLTPLFMIATGALVLGELPGGRGMAGIAVIVAGAYLLSLSDRRLGVLAPFRALVDDRGARAMLFVALIYSVSAAYDKVGTAASSPLFWAMSIHVVTAAVLAPVVLARRRWGAPRGSPAASPASPASPAASTPASSAPAAPPARSVVLAVVAAGLFTAVGAAAQMTALMLTLAAYVIAVKRTSTLFSVVLGGSVFREARVRERLLGAAVMLAGFVLVTTG